MKMQNSYILTFFPQVYLVRKKKNNTFFSLPNVV